MNMTVDPMTASVSGMSSTCRFVLSVATSHLRCQQTLVEPPTDLDWNQVIEFAGNHGLIPLFCWNLRVQGIKVPDSSALDAYCRATGAQALRLSAALLPIIALFSERQIPVLAFKGPSLAAVLYSNVALRSYTDLDFLLLPEDVKRARLALQEDGWAVTEDIASIHEQSYLQSQCEYGLARKGTLVELQWALAPRFFSLDLPLADMIRRAVTVQVIGSPVTTLVGRRPVPCPCRPWRKTPVDQARLGLGYRFPPGSRNHGRDSHSRTCRAISPEAHCGRGRASSGKNERREHSGTIERVDQEGFPCLRDRVRTVRQCDQWREELCTGDFRVFQHVCKPARTQNG